MLEVRNLDLAIGGLQILRGVSLSIKPGEILSIIGPNGAGKSSLLNCLNGFYRSSGGTIQFDSRDITRWSADRIARLGVARTFQNIEVFPHFTVLENVLLGRHIHARHGFTKALFFTPAARREEAAHWRRCEEILEFMGMSKLRDIPIGGLPYGVRKKVELARALAMEPRLLLLDEPIAGMTQHEKEDMMGYVLELNRHQGLTVCLIDHDMRAIMNMSHRVCVLNVGELLAEGTPHQVQSNPDVIQAYLGESQSSSGVLSANGSNG